MPHFFTDDNHYFVVSSYITSQIDRVLVDSYQIDIHWTHNDQLLSFVRHLNKIVCTCNSRGLKTPETSKMEYFVTIPNAVPKKETVKNSAKK